MGVRVVKTEPKCKLCKSAERAKIDALLELRSKRATDEAGVRVNTEYVLRRCADFGVANPTADNLKGHWKNHCEVVDEKEQGQIDAAHAAATEEILEKVRRGEKVNPDDVLDAILKQGMAEMELRVLTDGKAGITVDHLLKAVGEKTKRKHNEAQTALLDALGGGISQVFEKALGGPEERPAIQATPAGEVEVVDAEPEESE